jgi:hypothetical protein
MPQMHPLSIRYVQIPGTINRNPLVEGYKDLTFSLFKVLKNHTFIRENSNIKFINDDGIIPSEL